MKRNMFFSLICSKECQLELPSEFVEEHGNQLSDVVVLKVRIGDTWNISLRRFAGRIMFSGGWKDFADHYSLDVGYCLFFTYNGNSKFDVVICDVGDTEIIYPNKPVKFEELIHGNKTVVPMLANSVTGSKFVKNLSFTNKKGKQIIEAGEPALCRMVENAAINEVHAAKPSFVSNCPFFKVNLSPNYYKHGHMFFQANFLQSYVPAFNGSVTLQVANMEKKWLVGCYSTNFKNGVRWRMSRGLRAFIREANIKVGKTCIFELIDKENVVFNVTVLSQ